MIALCYICWNTGRSVVLGWLADVVGRKHMYGYELTIIILATLGQCITGHSSASA